MRTTRVINVLMSHSENDGFVQIIDALGEYYSNNRIDFGRVKPIQYTPWGRPEDIEDLIHMHWGSSGSGDNFVINNIGTRLTFDTHHGTANKVISRLSVLTQKNIELVSYFCTSRDIYYQSFDPANRLYWCRKIPDLLYLSNQTRAAIEERLRATPPAD